MRGRWSSHRYETLVGGAWSSAEKEELEAPESAGGPMCVRLVPRNTMQAAEASSTRATIVALAAAGASGDVDRVHAPKAFRPLHPSSGTGAWLLFFFCSLAEENEDGDGFWKLGLLLALALEHHICAQRCVRCTGSLFGTKVSGLVSPRWRTVLSKKARLGDH